MLRYLVITSLMVATTSRAADLPPEPPSIDDATAFCRFVTRKKLGNPPGLVWANAQPTTKVGRGDWRVRVVFHADGIVQTSAVCKLRSSPNGDLREIP
ncbi:MAG: hypothetical protein M3Y67_04810 [Pseudomonadota bacterium]|nr:hypothetical protein [Pseudomonadota bacterium]